MRVVLVALLFFLSTLSQDFQLAPFLFFDSFQVLIKQLIHNYLDNLTGHVEYNFTRLEKKF
jgi:hypothetical protein